jgi:hypothetical protein
LKGWDKMSEFESKRDKRKSFAASNETIEKINEIIKKSGKQEVDFFEDLVHDLAIGRLTDENNEEIPADLRTHFQSDVQKMKNATNSIVSIFVSQMENIAVEKDKWKSITAKQVEERDLKIQALESENKGLSENLAEANKANETLTSQAEEITKRIGLLEGTVQDREKIIVDKDEKIEDLKSRLNTLNETIVDKDQQLKEVAPIKEEKRRLEEQVKMLQVQTEQLKEKHKEDLQKKEDVMDLERKKAELELREEFQKEKEQIRNETRKETAAAERETVEGFYREQIKRLEEGHQKQIAQLQQEIERLSRQPSRNKNK